MKLTLAESRFLKDPINIISELVNEVTLKIKGDNVELVAMDPANVAMVKFNLLSSAFVEYSVEKPIDISVNLDNLKHILRRAKSSDVLSLELNGNKLKIEFSGDSKRTFNLALLDLDDQGHKEPDLKFTGKVEMSSSILDEAIEDMGVVSDAVLIGLEKENISIQASGNMSNAKINMPASEDINIKLDGEKISSKYSIEYLRKMMKGAKLTDSAHIYLGNDYPLKIEYKVRDKMSLQFILAPRVKND
ncbi:proliferating cell nuclear antigen (pcna) [Candidatus Woesearchaeota archaeon]|nr:proliferating cell nuclear antigen (pcna) [Candidatus Woesearchaeota archaeon]